MLLWDSALYELCYPAQSSVLFCFVFCFQTLLYDVKNEIMSILFLFFHHSSYLTARVRYLFLFYKTC